MPATERLYYNDSHLIEFEARVIEISERVSGWTAVTLDRTAFYPTGGGQPSDTGTINGLRVVECIDDEDNGVLHVIQGRPPEVGTNVNGRVDWLRRDNLSPCQTGRPCQCRFPDLWRTWVETFAETRGLANSRE